MRAALAGVALGRSGVTLDLLAALWAEATLAVLIAVLRIFFLGFLAVIAGSSMLLLGITLESLLRPSPNS